MPLNEYISENYHVPLPEFLKIINSKHANWHIFIDKPYMLIRHVSETARFLGELIENQLSELDPLTEPEGYKALSSIAKGISKFSETNQSLGIEYYLKNVLNNLEKEV